MMMILQDWLVTLCNIVLLRGFLLSRDIIFRYMPLLLRFLTCLTQWRVAYTRLLKVLCYNGWIVHLVVHATTTRHIMRHILVISSSWIAHRGYHYILYILINWKVYCRPRYLHLLRYSKLRKWKLLTILLCLIISLIRRRTIPTWFHTTRNIRWSWIRLFLRIGTTFGSPKRITSIFCGIARGLICHLMIVHTHQLIYQVAKLCRISINLISTCATHRWLFIFKLLL